MKYFKQVFERRNSEGTTFGSITKDDLHSLSVVYPQSALLKKYDNIVSDYNKMIFVRSLENRDLAKLRDWILPPVNERAGHSNIISKVVLRG